MDSKTIFKIFFVTIAGVLIGIGGYTFIYAKGYSYLSDNPTACVNCHIMREQFNSWHVASHRDIPCNGCHTPDNFVMKYIVKAENGFNHSWAFTIQTPEVIRIKKSSASVVEENCIRCHKETLSGVAVQTHTNRVRCSTCHRNSGHAS